MRIRLRIGKLGREMSLAKTYKGNDTKLKVIKQLGRTTSETAIPLIKRVEVT